MATFPSDGERPSTISFSERTKGFIEVIRKASIEIDAIEKFQTDVVSILNPKAGTVACAFCFPIIQHDETSHSGMKTAFTKIAESFQIIETDDDGRCTLLPNVKYRKINLMVDGLSSWNFAMLK